MSLIEYAEKHATKCFICTIPEREEIEDAYKKGVKPKMIESWLLEERGYESVKRESISHHMARHVNA